MRLVLKVARIADHSPECWQTLARAIAELVRDGHFLTVIHGQRPGVQSCSTTNTNGDSHPSYHAQGAEFTAAERENRVLISFLAEAKLMGIGLRATDAGLIQLRKQHLANSASAVRVEAARLDSRWLEIICTNRGVPVVSNLACSVNGDDYLIDPDQMVAVCAADWNADALIYITEEDGVPGAQGGILRWFDIDSNNGLPATLSDEMRARLEACAMALKHGVRRVRILPFSNVDCLSSFYFSSIKYGTEVIAGMRQLRLIEPST